MRTFLQALAVERQVTASTQNQARHAVVFFYQYILQQSLDDLEGLAQAKRPQLQLVEVHRTWPDSAPEIYTSVK